MNLTKLINLKEPILILGNSGTGKTHLAKKIHEQSNLHQQDLIHVNISSLCENLFESELFGHVKGSFSGALTDKIGFFEKVGSGIIFLDEIGELNLSLQVKLLTVIETGEYYPVGSVSKKKFNGRIIFATNKNLVEEVEQGRFREDLYFRIRFYQVELKNLNDKNDKIEIIMNAIADVKTKCKSQLCISEDVLNILFNYHWPGNYRELYNTLTYMFNIAEMRINLSDIPSWISTNNETEQILKEHKDYSKALIEFEKKFIILSLLKYNGRVVETANNIGISKVTLISKLKKYDIDRRQYKNTNIMVG